MGCKLIMSSSYRWPRQMAASNGLCRYGARVDCCWGWTRRSWGHCQREYHNRLLMVLLLLLLGGRKGASTFGTVSSWGQ